MDNHSSSHSDNSEPSLLLGRQLSAPIPNERTSSLENQKATGPYKWVGRTSPNEEPNDIISVPPWKKETTAALISHYGVRILQCVNSSGVPLLCDAVVQQQLDSAELLSDFARDLGLFVDINNGSCPTLDWAIRKASVDMAKFILDYVAERRLSVDESCSILTNYLIPLIKTFPNLMAEYLENDKFSFEYGRFKVPYTLFEKNGKRPIAMTTDVALADWTIMDNETARGFWMQNSEEYAVALTETSDLQVDVSAKFFCIDQHFVRENISAETVGIQSEREVVLGWNHMLRMLSKSNLPVSVFTSESVKTFINWMFYSLYNRFLFLLIVDVLTAGLFSFFAASYGLRQERPSNLDRRFLRLLIILSFALPLMTLILKDSKIKIFNIVNNFLLTVHAFQSDQQDQFSAFLTSIGCIFCWMTVVEDLLPFDRIGPFVSMAIYSMKAVIPFSGLGASILIGFSFAFRVLFNQKFYKHKGSSNQANDTSTDTMGADTDNGGEDDEDEEDFSSFFHVLKILFHAAVGNFEEEVFRSTDTFIGVWRSLLFNGFIFVGGIVLISLLIAILGETYNNVRSTEKEELMKCRAEIVGTTLRYVAHRFVPPAEKSRTHDSDRHYEEMLKKSKARAKNWFRRFHLKSLDRQRYFHYLVRVTKTDEERSREESSDAANKVKDHNERFQPSQQTIQNVQTQIHHMDERVKTMEINIARVLEKLDHLTTQTA